MAGLLCRFSSFSFSFSAVTRSRWPSCVARRARARRTPSESSLVHRQQQHDTPRLLQLKGSFAAAPPHLPTSARTRRRMRVLSGMAATALQKAGCSQQQHPPSSSQQQRFASAGGRGAAASVAMASRRVAIRARTAALEQPSTNGASAAAAVAPTASIVEPAPPLGQQDQPYSRLGSATIHAGERATRPRMSDTITIPIACNSTYAFSSTQEVIDFNEGRLQSHEYGRYGNPTSQCAADKIKALEGAEDCLISASGMNSVVSMLLSLVPAGGHIITTSDCYWRTRQFMQNFLPKMSITVSVIAPNDFEGLEAALQQHKNTALFFSESPTNPYLRCVDIPKIAELCHKQGAVVCIDSTFATPINSRALELGADLVLHSATKYLAGHNDVLAGALAGKKELVDQVRTFHHIMGGVVDPHAAYLLLRGLKTLDLRVKRHNESALIIAQRLEAHPKVTRVWYPGLPSHPDHAIARRQMAGGFGGVVSFEVEGGLWDAARFIDAVRIPYIAPSLGGVESLIEMPAVQSYWGFGPEKRASIGIKENLVRFSVGVEDVEDIWEDLEQALAKV